MGSRSLVFEVEAGIVVCLLSKHTPSDDEWNQYAAAVVSHLKSGRLQGSLVLTEGGVPSARQRGMIISSLDGLAPPPTAMISSSPVVRGVATALSWMRSDGVIKVFKPSELDYALEFLRLSPAQKTQVRAVLERLERAFGARHEALSA